MIRRPFLFAFRSAVDPDLGAAGSRSSAWRFQSARLQVKQAHLQRLLRWNRGTPACISLHACGIRSRSGITGESALNDSIQPVGGGGIHPVHAFLLAASVPLFLGGLFSDLAYSSSYEIQWTNFASWLIAGALVFAGLALAWAFIDLLRADRAWRGRPLVYFFLLLAAWILGFVNALVHAKDAWAKMPEALTLSLIVSLLILGAAWLGFATLRRGDAR